MAERFADGSAGDADYGRVGTAYTRYRKPDERIGALIHEWLGEAREVLNVGAGAGAYEPTDRRVTAVEPSASMRGQRAAHLSTAIDAVAERLPFAAGKFDAAMATFTVHQWPDLRGGLREMRRVTRGRSVIMTCDPDEVDRFWLNEYAPEVIATEAKRYPPIGAIAEGLGGRSEVVAVPIPLDCTDGFNEAYYGRPERLLEEGARLACSAWGFVEKWVVERFVGRLRGDLEDGSWDAKYGGLRRQGEYLGSLKLVVSMG